jgi:hypothetical protein
MSIANGFSSLCFLPIAVSCGAIAFSLERFKSRKFLFACCFYAFYKQIGIWLTHFAYWLTHFQILSKSTGDRLSHFSVFRKQTGNMLSQTGVCFLISVFSASKLAICFLKLEFAFSFQCFPQTNRALAD